MRTARFATVLAMLGALPAAAGAASISDFAHAPVVAATFDRLAMSDGGVGNGAGSGWTPFPEKNRATSPDVPPPKAIVVRPDGAARKKVKAAK
jgi:hypothetical protein